MEALLKRNSINYISEKFYCSYNGVHVHCKNNIVLQNKPPYIFVWHFSHLYMAIISHSLWKVSFSIFCAFTKSDSRNTICRIFEDVNVLFLKHKHISVIKEVMTMLLYSVLYIYEHSVFSSMKSSRTHRTN